MGVDAAGAVAHRRGIENALGAAAFERRAIGGAVGIAGTEATTDFFAAFGIGDAKIRGESALGVIGAGFAQAQAALALIRGGVAIVIADGGAVAVMGAAPLHFFFFNHIAVGDKEVQVAIRGGVFGIAVGVAVNGLNNTGTVTAYLAVLAGEQQFPFSVFTYLDGGVITAAGCPCIGAGVTFFTAVTTAEPQQNRQYRSDNNQKPGARHNKPPYNNNWVVIFSHPFSGQRFSTVSEYRSAPVFPPAPCPRFPC